jgi:hypothetical protein
MMKVFLLGVAMFSPSSKTFSYLASSVKVVGPPHLELPGSKIQIVPISILNNTNERCYD